LARSPRPRPFAAGLAALALAACHGAPHLVTAPREPAAASLAHDLDAILDAPPLQRSYWGVMVRSLATGRTLYARNGGRLLMPASNLKIVTLAAAADRLGWSYTYETRLFAPGPVRNGELQGDLLVVGSGDPQIGEGSPPTAVFDGFAGALIGKGIHRIDGRIVGDDNAWNDETLGFGWSWDDLSEGYAAPVGPLQFANDSVQVTVAPGPETGASAAVTISPPGALAVVNEVSTSAAGSPPSIEARRSAGAHALVLRGSVPAGLAPIVRMIAVDNPTQFFATMLRQTLVSDGVDVAGPAVDVDDIRDAPPRQGEAAAYRSPPLSDLAVRLMKSSQNQYAETLLMTIAAAAGTPTFAAGRRVVVETMERWGVAPGALIMADGSGLSRYNYVTPDALVTILAHVDADAKLKGPFEAALPVGGEDGTLEHRFGGTPAAANVRAKTGSMTGVRALSGYVTTADGERLAFSILANNFGVSADIVKAIDAIVVRLAGL
jgi:D-alanyl-D-alanine carboxypeptidase/D-alanyl-D-alanine-endopeptidase (penicillin-binding protein 4)